MNYVGNLIQRPIDGTFGTPSTTRWTPIRTPVTGGREVRLSELSL